MDDDGERSVTQWICNLKAGDRGEAPRQIWERYFGRLARLAQVHLRSAARGPADGEDIALSVFDSLFRGAAEGRFPKLDGRDDLWKLLTTIALRKASNQRRREGQLKRGGGRVIGGGDLAGDSDGEPLAQVAGSDPTPELAVMLVEEVRDRFLDLPDESLRVVALLRMEGFTNEEIARALDCSPSSVDRKLDLIRKAWAREASR